MKVFKARLKVRLDWKVKVPYPTLHKSMKKLSISRNRTKELPKAKTFDSKIVLLYSEDLDLSYFCLSFVGATNAQSLQEHKYTA